MKHIFDAAGVREGLESTGQNSAAGLAGQDDNKPVAEPGPSPPLSAHGSLGTPDAEVRALGQACDGALSNFAGR